MASDYAFRLRLKHVPTRVNEEGTRQKVNPPNCYPRIKDGENRRIFRALVGVSRRTEGVCGEIPSDRSGDNISTERVLGLRLKDVLPYLAKSTDCLGMARRLPR